MVRFECIQKIEDAQKWWSVFSPQKTICDSWEYRYCFYKLPQYKIFFWVGFVQDEPIGLLPLQYNSDKQYLEFFGGSYMEDNRVFIKSGFEQYISEFYKQIQEPARLEYISGEDAFTQSLSVLDYKYFLPLQNIQSFEEYLAKFFDGEGRGKMRRKVRKIEQNNIQIVKNKREDLEKLFEFNISNFGEDSTFHLPFRTESFRELFQLPFSFTLLSFEINGKLEGVSLSLLSKGVYEYLNLGANTEWKELRTYIHIKNIEEALAQGAQSLNAFSSDCGWKELFHFQKTPQYKFIWPQV